MLSNIELSYIVGGDSGMPNPDPSPNPEIPYQPPAFSWPPFGWQYQQPRTPVFDDSIIQ